LILSDILIFLTIIYVLSVIIFFFGLFIKKSGANSLQYDVTVIIAARNEEKNIANILEDLIHQIYPKDFYQVIIVNDGSTDNTQNIIDSYAQKYSFIHSFTVEEVPEGFSPKKYALQCAINKTSSDIILSTDADCRVSSRWIESMVSYFDPNVGFVIGFSQFGRKKTKQNLIERLQAFDFMQMMGVAAGTCNLGFAMAASGQNLGYRRKAFKQIGGYSQIAHRVSGDDVLLLQLIKRHTKYKIVFASDSSCFVTSKPQPDLVSFINQRIRWASNGSYQIYLNVPFFAYLLQFYLYSFFLLFGLLIALLSGHYISLFLAGMLVKFTFDFIITAKSAHYFNRPDLLKCFPVWFLFQLPYVIYVGLLGTFGNFRWKERNHTTVFNKNPKKYYNE